MPIHSMTPAALGRLMLAMAAVLAAYALYYLARGDWVVTLAALVCAGALGGIGGFAAASGRHPAAGGVLAALVALNAGAVIGITALALIGVVWLAPLVFVNFLLGGVRNGSIATLASVALIIGLGEHWARPDLALNVVGAVALSLLMAGTFAQAMRRQVDRLEAEALRDPLTGLLNRRAFETRFDERLERSAEPASLVFLDLDRFKVLNDRCGHAAGDEVLGRFASLALAELRRSDALFRYGGEEFLLVLEAPLADAIGVAEKLRRAVAEHPFPEAAALTVSAGLAGVVPGEDREAVVARADEALYAAKSAGRDRCAVAYADGRIAVVGAAASRQACG